MKRLVYIRNFFSCEEQEKKVTFDVQEMPSIPLEGEVMEEELLQ